MAGFDQPGLFFSDSYIGEEQEESAADRNRQQTRTGFRNFLREFLDDNSYKYRDQLKRRCNTRQFYVEIDLEDLQAFNKDIADKIKNQPSEYLSLFEEAAREVADEVTRPRPEEDEDIPDIQIMIKSDALPSTIRAVKSANVSKLIKIPGIVVAASSVRAKAISMSLQCRTCKNIINDVRLKPGLEGLALPRKCNADQAGGVPCPLDPYFIIPDRCKCVDYQVLKLQEAPEDVPTGEMPRHMQLFCDRFLTERVVPGNRVFVTGIYSIKKTSGPPTKRSAVKEKSTVGIRAPYVRVVGIDVDATGPGRSTNTSITPEEEERFTRLANLPNIYDLIVSSIAPSIYGADDIKKAAACLLFGGSRKRLPDGLTRRGDINVLLLGDPGTAKSQILKFVERVAPIGVYTSGKGSSAAGLTASVNRDPVSRNFVMEGGAMVLADGGVVCIDEFDKMREDDRVAIHEAMEQQTISIAKAGITTTLNSRCAVLAAANSIFGRWDDTKGTENIDFMPTILSRFDMIFIVKDEHNPQRDMTLAKHVMRLHMNAAQAVEQNQEGELDMPTLKKFISYCRARCGPRLSKEAGEKLRNRYVMMRGGSYERDYQRKNSIPITVRQLEAIIRISECLAKMQLKPFATGQHVDEALRLFQASTLDAAQTGSLSGAEGFTTQEDQDMLHRIERQLKRRFPIGSQVSEHTIIQDFVKQQYAERSVQKVVHIMLLRGEIQHRMQRKMLYRLR